MTIRHVVSGAAVLGVAAMTLTIPPAGAAQSDGRVADDTIEVGPSIDDRIAARLSGDAKVAFSELQETAASNNADLGLGSSPRDRVGSGERGAIDDSPVADPGPTPAVDATQHPLVGTEREWLALDDLGLTPGNVFGYYEKNYRLAAVGDFIEVWVSVGDNGSYDPGTGTYTLPFDAPGDCRNTITYDGQTRVEVTPQQINQLVADFDLNIYPLETAALATPPDRNGEASIYNLYNQFVFGGALTDRPDGYFTTPDGGGKRTVALIDNVRDDAYYTSPDVEPLSYIAGFFSPFYNDAFDRNVMTIDAFDWLHRTGAEPRDDASPDPCAGAAARPFLYEGTFAHEWQHLLQSYVAGGAEVTWVNEGLSDWVQTLTGYVDPSQSIDEPEYDSHIQCFTGFLAQFSEFNQSPRADSGPENSLTLWQDQGPGEILCDYGAVYTFAEYVYGQFGQAALQFLFAAPDVGLAGVDAMLDAMGDDRSAMDFLHDWTIAVALDGPLGDNGQNLRGGVANDYVATKLDSFINWDVDDAYDTPGAPPNGSDYVRLRGDDGYVSGNQIRSVEFDGSATAFAPPTAWTVVDDAGDAVLFSGAGDNLDNSIAFEATVPAGDPTLTLDTLFAIEPAWDYGFVQVSTDGGQTWTSLDNGEPYMSIPPEPNPGYEYIAAELPGIGGYSPGWITASFDLSAYAGQDVLIGLRYLTDGAFVEPGWYVDDVTVGGTLLSDGSSVEFPSYEQLAPAPVEGWNVTLIGYRSNSRGTPAAVVTVPVAPGGSVSFDRGDLRDFRQHDVVAAIVTLDDSSESLSLYAPYELTVNGVLQPGGS